MVEIKPIEFTDVAQSTDVKDKDQKSKLFYKGKPVVAPGDKYVRQFANLVIGKNPIIKIYEGSHRIDPPQIKEIGNNIIFISKDQTNILNPA